MKNDRIKYNWKIIKLENDKDVRTENITCLTRKDWACSMNSK